MTSSQTVVLVQRCGKREDPPGNHHRFVPSPCVPITLKLSLQRLGPPCSPGNGHTTGSLVREDQRHSQQYCQRECSPCPPSRTHIDEQGSGQDQRPPQPQTRTTRWPRNNVDNRERYDESDSDRSQYDCATNNKGEPLARCPPIGLGWLSPTLRLARGKQVHD